MGGSHVASFLCWLCFLYLFKNSKDKKTSHLTSTFNGKKRETETFDFFVSCCGNICRLKRTSKDSTFLLLFLCKFVSSRHRREFISRLFFAFVFEFFPLINYVEADWATHTGRRFDTWKWNLTLYQSHLNVRKLNSRGNWKFWQEVDKNRNFCRRFMFIICSYWAIHEVKKINIWWRNVCKTVNKNKQI